MFTTESPIGDGSAHDLDPVPARRFRPHCAMIIGALALSTACSAIDSLAPTEPVDTVQQRALGESLNTTPTPWWWYYGQTPAQLSSLLARNDARLVSLQVESAEPLLLTAALVKNAGSYQKTSWWSLGQTASELAAEVSRRHARIIDIDTYVLNGVAYFAAIMVPNAGADAKTWWWYPNLTLAEIARHLQENGARLIDLHQYSIRGATRYAVVMLANSGADATPSWWYDHLSLNDVRSAAQTNHAFLTSLEPAIRAQRRST